MFELVVTLKDSVCTHKQRYVGIFPITVKKDDDYIQACIKQAMESFKGTPEHISIKIAMDI